MLAPRTADTLPSRPHVAHGFFTRHGGVSQGGYASLNCGLGSKDDPAAVRENRARVAAFLTARACSPRTRCTAPTAVVVDEAWSLEERPRADAIVTATPGLALGVLTADCAPVLFADRKPAWSPPPMPAGAAPSAACWRRRSRPWRGWAPARARIEAAVGPCIGQAAYEVGPDFEREFLARDRRQRPLLYPPRPHTARGRISTCRATSCIACSGPASASVRSLASCTYAQDRGFLQLSALAGAKRGRLRPPNLRHRLDLALVFHNFRCSEAACIGHARSFPLSETGRRRCQQLGNPLGYRP